MQAYPRKKPFSTNTQCSSFYINLHIPQNQKMSYAKDWFKDKIFGFKRCKRYIQKDWIKSLVLAKKTSAASSCPLSPIPSPPITHQAKFHHNLLQTIWRHVHVVFCFKFLLSTLRSKRLSRCKVKWWSIYIQILSDPQSADSQCRETFLAPPADNRTGSHDADCFIYLWHSYVKYLP